MEAVHTVLADRQVRAALVDHYARMAGQYEGSTHRSWHERLAAATAGDILIEPGWLLRRIVGDDVDIYGFYRAYPDGRIERDRYVEHVERDRFRRA
jgi:hypothetical protein